MKISPLHLQYVISLSFTAATTFLLAIFVYLRNSKRLLNKLFAFYSISITCWCVGQIFLTIASNYSKTDALLWGRLLHIGVVFIPTTFVHFAFVILDLKPNKKLLSLSYLLSFAFLLSIPSKYFIPDAIPKLSFRFFITAGVLYYFLIVFFVFMVTYGLYRLYKGYKQSTGIKQNQLKYLFWSSLFGYLGGSPNLLLVLGFELYPLNPFGTYAVGSYIFVIGYAILKFNLMDIKIASTRAGLFTIVYTLVLGIPLGLTVWGKYWLQDSLGSDWYWAPVILAIVLASAGPFILIKLIRQAEAVILKEEKRYQQAISDLTKTIIEIRDLDKLLDEETSTITKEVKVSFCAMYLKSGEYESFRLKSVHPEESKSCSPEFISYDDSLITTLNAHNKPLLSEEVGKHDKIFLDSGLVIPCFGKDGLLSVIILGAKQNNQMYTNDDLLVLENLSYATSLAIENCTYWKEIEERQRKARIQEMDTYSYSLAHEINNPMQTVLGETLLLKEELPQEITDEAKRREIEKAFDLILEAARRVFSMVKAIRDFGAPVTGEEKPLKIEDVVESFSSLFLPQIRGKGIIFEKIMPTFVKSIFIRGEKPELMQVLVNLANNAVHALIDAQEKKIILKVDFPRRDWVKISFSDTGYGIGKEKLRTIFAAFVTSKASTEGTGMGLYYAKKVIDRYKGRIWAESEGKGKGATFIIELPIAKDITKDDLKEDSFKRKRVF